MSLYKTALPIASAVQVRPGDAIRFRRMTVEEVGGCNLCMVVMPCAAQSMCGGTRWYHALA